MRKYIQDYLSILRITLNHTIGIQEAKRVISTQKTHTQNFEWSQFNKLKHRKGNLKKAWFSWIGRVVGVKIGFHFLTACGFELYKKKNSDSFIDEKNKAIYYKYQDCKIISSAQ